MTAKKMTLVFHRIDSYKITKHTLLESWTNIKRAYVTDDGGTDLYPIFQLTDIT